MINIKKFAFNPFQVNTYVIFDETKECAIIDPGCYDEPEKEIINSFIAAEGLKPVVLINTHSHIDHIVGNEYISGKYGIRLTAHEDGINFISHSEKSASVYGFENAEFIEPQIFVKEGDVISFGNIHLRVIETPGHANGSICLVSEEDKFVIVGDVLFLQGIGRTDLPTGNYNQLLNSINEKLFILDDSYKVYSGHGPDTTIGFEKASNPFLVKL